MADQSKFSEAKRSLLEKYLRGEIPSSLERRNGITPRETGNIAPLSVTQQQVWLHHHIVPKDIPVYNETLTIHRTGPLDPGMLERCLREIVRRHEIWRTTFDSNGEELVQIVHPTPQTFPLQVMDLTQVPEAEREAEALWLATEDARRPFDLKTGPLLRALLVSLSDQQHRIYMTLHHLICDAVTAYRVLVPELGTLYEAFSAGQASPLPEPQLQYADFACWQRRNLSPAISSEHEAYWRKQMAGELPLCQWPNDRPRPTVETHRGAIERFAFPATLVQRLRVLSQQAGVSLYMTLLAGFVALLKRYTEQDELVIGSLTAGRNRVELEKMMGHFVNPLALRFDVSGNPTFRELQLRVRNVVLEGLAHESVPFSQVVKLAQQRNDPGRHPLFQIIFSQQPQLQHVTPGWELITEEVSNGGSKLDLTLVIDDHGDAVSGPITYNPDLFDVSTLRRAVEHWRTLLESAADDASRGILDLPILTERERILFDWNRAALEFPRSKTLHELFEDQVKKTPDAVAITFGDQSLTYHELNQRADQVARHLQSLGVGPDVPVGLFVERSFEMMAGILGVLKAGGACLPLDPAYPAERLSFMLEETQAQLVLTHSRLLAQLPAHNAEVICLDTVCLDTEPEFRGKDLLPTAVQAASATNIAYVIYTSGSTGHPKGVRVTHSGLVNSTLARTAYYRETLRSFLLLSSFTFDSSLAGIFWTLTVGGTLVLPPDSSRWELDSVSVLIEKHQISHLLCVPSLYQTLIENSPSERLASLKVAIVAGESCPVALVEEHYRRLPHAALYNEYGPTEATVWCSVYRCEPQPDAIRVPIGRPIANTQMYVLDSRRQMVPVGVPGELYVGGAGVAGGYWNRPELTAEKFISDPFSSTPKARLYKTGDLARFLPDGNIEYLGRVDHQVKIRGFRIELGEIEAALASHPGVREVAVVAREDAPGEKRLVAYYTVSNVSGKATGAGELRSHLSVRLPDYMVPAAYVQMEGMPLTANGKLDRKALPVPGGDAYAVRGYEAPQGEIETRLAQIWADVLKIDRVGRNDNFFELGGHSLLAMILIERMRRQGLRVNVRALFMTPTLEELSAAADDGSNQEVPENRIPLKCEMITPDMLSLATLSQEEIDRIVNSIPGGAANVQDIYPLAPLQEGILFHHLLGGEGDPYLLCGLWSFDTRRRLDSYVEAMQKVIDRHDILRTAVMWEGLREPVQVVQRKALLLVEEVKLDATGGDASRLLYARFDPRHHRIDVRQAPLLRAHIAYDEQNDRWLMAELLHHLAEDHVTLEVIQEELQAHLLKQTHTLPAPQPFRNLVAQARLGMSRAEHQAYFQKLLGDVDEPTAPFGLLDVQGDGTGIEEAKTLLDNVLAGRIRERARKLGVSAASVCHLAWAQVLARVSGRDDVVFGTVLFGRMQAGQDADRGMGLFMNTLPVRIHIGEEGVEVSVRLVHTQLANLLHHEHASLALAQRCSGVAAPTPLFSALLNYRHIGGDARTRSKETERAWEGMELLHREERTNYPFTMSVDDLGDGFSLTAQTVTSVSAERVSSCMRMALEGLVEALEKQPGKAVHLLDVLPPAEREQVLFKFNDTAVEYSREKCIHELFEEQVEKSPQATAVVFQDTSLSYAELNGRANQLAHHLRELGVKPDTCVGICMERGLEMVVGLLAILKAGGTYVPLDPRHPAGRLRHLLEDSAPALLLTEGQIKELFSGLGAALPVLDLADAAGSWKSKPTMDPVSAGLTPEHLAYVIYTSGSTGDPKGVRVTHSSLVNSTLARTAYYDETLRSFLLLSSFTFDSSLAGIFWTLAVGGALVLPPDSSQWELDSLSSLIERHQISHLLCVPSLYQTLIESSPSERLTSLKVAIVAGESCPVALVEAHYRRLPHAALYNEYGPTEATVWCSVYRCEPQPDAIRVPIGRPIANTQLYVLDPHLQPVPVGVPGELYVGGAGVAGGYWNRHDLTAEKFITNPFSATPGACLYKTGDLARFQPDGNIEYLGRVDHQVKIRGFRIELGEIEAALASHPLVREVAVVAREDEPGEKRLVAYYTGSNANGKATGVAELRAHLSSKLPDYMVPAAYVRIDSMPLTANGKLDRKALPRPQGDAYSVRGYEAPLDEMETRLAEIWADVLKIDRVGRNDNFFELGGHSLLAMQVMARIRHHFNLELPVRSIFDEPTVAGSAVELQKAQALGSKAHARIAQLRPGSAPSPSREALLAQLGNLSASELQRLLQRVRDEKHSP